MPQPEGPARLAKQLKLLAVALAIVRGQNNIDEAIYGVVKKVARDTVPHVRLVLLGTLWKMYLEAPDGWFRTRDISLRTDIPFSTAKLQLENLGMLRLITRAAEAGAGTSAHIWRPSQQMYEWAVGSEIFT
jgi:hypothetical protein